MSLTQEPEVRRRIEHLEALIQNLERLPDPAARDQARELVQTLLDFHGEAVSKVLERIAGLGEPGHALIASLADDDVVSSLLLLYGLHPVDLETRVAAALEQVRPYLKTHGGNVELVGVTDGVVRLRMQGSCHGCPSSAMTLKNSIEEAIYAAAPDVEAIEVLDVVDPPMHSEHLLPIVSLDPRLTTRSPDFPAKVTFMQPESAPARNPMSTLRQFVRKPPGPPAEHCELCGLALPADHSHLLEPATRKLLCSCEACAILFSGHQGGRYKRVPRDIESLPGFRLSDLQWEDLHLPINLAFFVESTPAQRVLALYPSPAGAVESLLTLEAWQGLVAENPVLGDLEPDVEALLVNRIKGDSAYYRVPIDECFKLVGLIRMHWRGLSGGNEVWDEVARFFVSLNERSRPR